MRVHVLHWEHTLNFLGMQSLCRGTPVSGLPQGRQNFTGPPAMSGIRWFTGRELFSHSDCSPLIMRKLPQHTSRLPFLAKQQ